MDWEKTDTTHLDTILIIKIGQYGLEMNHQKMFPMLTCMVRNRFIRVWKMMVKAMV
jgi:hypothetical protein